MHAVRAEPAMTKAIERPIRPLNLASIRPAVLCVACCLVALGLTLAHAQQVTDNTGLVSAVEADALRAEVVMALAEQRHADVLASMAKYRKLESQGVVVPVSLLFAESESAQALNDWPRAQLALGEYLQRADPTDPLYSESLRRYPAIEAKAREAADAHEQQLVAAAAADQKLREAEAKAEVAKYYDGLVADMVSVPAGKFRMGDSTGHGGADERPLRNVVIAAFKLARHEVTFAQFDRFCAATGRTPPDDNGWGRDDRPVINVSWDDAVAYIDWLNTESGRKFRLPSEAEWEYAARAGTTTDFWWGPEFSSDRGNAKSTGGADQWAGTAPVGQFPANPLGLFDMNGNVREWVQDCWHQDYADAPVDGQPWQTGDCNRRVLRGGAWNQDPTSLRSADRDWDDHNFRFTDRGFRLAMSE